MPGETVRVAVADDNSVIRETLRDILTENGYSVETVSNGYELLADIKNRSPHVIILDLVMPDKDGLAIFSTIRSISPDTKIIIYTGYSQYGNSVFATSADRFMLKNEHPEVLLAAVRELVRH